MKDLPLADIFAGAKPLAALSTPKDVIRQFTPNWFAATMGTGILALALTQFPWPVPGLYSIAEGLWMFNILLFTLFSLAYLARWILYLDEAKRIFGHSTVSMFFGTIPMGLATIINGLLVFGIPRWGVEVVPIALVLWWLDVALAIVCGVCIPYMMFTRQTHNIDQMTAVWLLPVVAAEVAAVSGGLIAPHLNDASLQLYVIITSYVLWAYSVPVALSILVILLLRMALHKLPHENMAASSWLALGPIGTASLGMLITGTNVPAIFAENNLTSLGTIASGLGFMIGLLFWGCGFWWMLLASLITRRYLRNGIPFNLGWWGFTFPLGVYAVTTLKLAEVLNIEFFSLVGALLVILLTLMWLLVAVKTVSGAWKGTLFVSPCINNANIK
jgi:C4-dicarboxylate transporter/malic acid transport protein